MSLDELTLRVKVTYKYQTLDSFLVKRDSQSQRIKTYLQVLRSGCNTTNKKCFSRNCNESFSGRQSGFKFAIDWVVLDRSLCQ